MARPFFIKEEMYLDRQSWITSFHLHHLPCCILILKSVLTLPKAQISAKNAEICSKKMRSIGTFTQINLREYSAKKMRIKWNSANFENMRSVETFHQIAELQV